MDCSSYDMARPGWLWRNGGAWRGKQIVPKAWLEAATRVNPDIKAHCASRDWKYGYGFWTNEHGKMWPHLPRDSCSAQGAGSHQIRVCPSLDLVVVQSPGTNEKPEDCDRERGILRRIVEAIR